MEAGTLYIVSTPIGNLGDITLRALEVLRGVSFILAEDTRQTRILLDHFEVGTPTVPYHEHNEARSVPRVLARLRSGESAALVSDAGTPLLSDPGDRLVRGALAAGITVVPIPGASALMAALVASGIDATRFTFFGFLPRAGRERREALQNLSALSHAGVLYEAPGRVAKSLRELADLGAGDREAVVARELTKRFEEFRRGTVTDLAAYYATIPPRGEVVVIVAGRTDGAIDEMTARNRARELLADGLSPRDVVTALARDHGVPRNMAYRLAHEL